MELRHLRYFIAVAEELSFRRAGTRLHVTQPSLSTQIRDLEKELDAQVLERDTHGVAITAAGRRFLDDARRILRDAGDSARNARRIAHGQEGRLAVGFVASLGHHLLPNVLRAYRAKFPDVDLQLSEMDTSLQIEALNEHRLDLGFIGLGDLPRTSDLQLIPVAEEKLVAVLPEDHPLARHGQAKSIRLAALAGERFFLSSRQSAPIYNPWIIALCQQAGFQPHDLQENGQQITVLNYVAAGLGVTVLPAQFSRLATQGVRFLMLSEPRAAYRYYAAWCPKNSHAALRNFLGVARSVTRLSRRSRSG